MAFNSRVSNKPGTDKTVSARVQLLKVSLIESPRYSFTSQKPPSLTCDKMSEPAPHGDHEQIQIQSRRRGGSWRDDASAVVMMATVAEPVATRITAAMNQP